MVSNKNINKICVIITVLAVLVTVLFMNSSALGVKADSTISFGYEDSLFDDSYVHTIDIAMDDWDSFIENATSEEYSVADVTIDGETVKNVGIRAKGNTSLSTVSQLGSERYSLKIEFDAYETAGNYHGLDKLCLNNLIQDYTMMKDYIAYTLMNEFGVDSPLVSYCYITVNGEDWGLYLAVEAVEDSFLERTYGTNYGDLYKPDSMSMGGGRGNGGGFDMKDLDFDELGMDNPFEKKSSDASKEDSSEKTESDSEEKSEKKHKRDSKEKSSDSDSNATDKNSPPSGDFSGGNMPDSGNGEMQDFGDGEMTDFQGGNMPNFGMGSSDAKLQYSDDDIDSYSTIFNSAKTNATTADKKRLIRALKSLSEGIENADSEEIANGVDVEEVMRYMVVHNFVVNGDSYTGNMIHNYYLYEEDGKLSMIPWDYNLAYGTFQGQDATDVVNDPIDTPQSVTEGSNDRPMFSWITSTEEYTEDYHMLYQEFIDQFYTSGYLEELVNKTYNMIYEYVEKDPTKFCSMEEFEKAVETMGQFVEQRCQSIEGQLDGTIPSTDSGQKEDSTNLIDASAITISDMGSMGGGGGNGFPGGGSGGFPGGDSNGFPGGPPGDEETSEQENPFVADNQDVSSTGTDDALGNANESSESFGPPSGFGGDSDSFSPPSGPGGDDDSFSPPEGFGEFSFSKVSVTDCIYAGVSAVAILVAIGFALVFKRQRRFRG